MPLDKDFTLMTSSNPNNISKAPYVYITLGFRESTSIHSITTCLLVDVQKSAFNNTCKIEFRAHPNCLILSYKAL